MKTIRCAIEGGVQVDSLLAMLVAENGSQPPLTDDCVAGVVTIESAGKAPVEALVLAPEQSFMKFKINGFNWREDALRIKIYRRPGDSSADIDYETDPTNPLYLDEASNPHGYTDDNNSMFSDGATEGGTTAASYDGSFGVSSVNTFGDGHDTGHVAGQSTLSYAESMATLKKQLADIEWSLAATGGKDATLQRKAGYRDPRGGEERDDVEEPLLGDFKDAGTLGRSTIGRSTINRSTIGRSTIGRSTIGRDTTGRDTLGRRGGQQSYETDGGFRSTKRTEASGMSVPGSPITGTRGGQHSYEADGTLRRGTEAGGSLRRGTEAGGSMRRGTEAGGSLRRGTEAGGSMRRGTEAGGSLRRGTEAGGSMRRGTEAGGRSVPPSPMAGRRGGQHSYEADGGFRSTKRTEAGGMSVPGSPMTDRRGGQHSYEADGTLRRGTEAGGSLRRGNEAGGSLRRGTEAGGSMRRGTEGGGRSVPPSPMTGRRGGQHSYEADGTLRRGTEAGGSLRRGTEAGGSLRRGTEAGGSMRRGTEGGGRRVPPSPMTGRRGGQHSYETDGGFRADHSRREQGLFDTDSEFSARGEAGGGSFVSASHFRESGQLSSYDPDGGYKVPKALGGRSQAEEASHNSDGGYQVPRTPPADSHDYTELLEFKETEVEYLNVRDTSGDDKRGDGRSHGSGFGGGVEIDNFQGRGGRGSGGLHTKQDSVEDQAPAVPPRGRRHEGYSAERWASRASMLLSPSAGRAVELRLQEMSGVIKRESRGRSRGGDAEAVIARSIKSDLRGITDVRTANKICLETFGRKMSELPDGFVSEDATQTVAFRPVVQEELREILEGVPEDWKPVIRKSAMPLDQLKADLAAQGLATGTLPAERRSRREPKRATDTAVVVDSIGAATVATAALGVTDRRYKDPFPRGDDIARIEDKGGCCRCCGLRTKCSRCLCASAVIAAIAGITGGLGYWLWTRDHGTKPQYLPIIASCAGDSTPAGLLEMFTELDLNKTRVPYDICKSTFAETTTNDSIWQKILSSNGTMFAGNSTMPTGNGTMLAGNSTMLAGNSTMLTGTGNETAPVCFQANMCSGRPGKLVCATQDKDGKFNPQCFFFGTPHPVDLLSSWELVSTYVKPVHCSVKCSDPTEVSNLVNSTLMTKLPIGLDSKSKGTQKSDGKAIILDPESATIRRKAAMDRLITPNPYVNVNNNCSSFCEPCGTKEMESMRNCNCPAATVACTVQDEFNNVFDWTAVSDSNTSLIKLFDRVTAFTRKGVKVRKCAYECSCSGH